MLCGCLFVVFLNVCMFLENGNVCEMNGFMLIVLDVISVSVCGKMFV